MSPALQFRELCQQHNLVATHQRQIIYETVMSLPGHPSPEAIYDQVKTQIPSISLATVYKNIQTFLNSGMLKKGEQVMVLRDPYNLGEAVAADAETLQFIGELRIQEFIAQCPNGRFTRDQIKARNDNLDIAWLRDTEAEAEEQLTEPEDIAAAIIGHLKAALEEIETLSDELEPNGVDKPAAVAEAAE